MSLIGKDAPGKEVLLMGNEAIARGALEAGISVATAYPGNPSSEIVGSLSQVAEEMGIYVEWSINEKVALEVAAAAAVSGLDALTAMKQNGLNGGVRRSFGNIEHQRTRLQNICQIGRSPASGAFHVRRSQRHSPLRV
jgi:hypothetical protein